MSSSAGTVEGGPPIVDAVARMRTELCGLVDAPTWPMTDAETRATLVELTRLAAQVAELELRVASHAEASRVGDETGATSMGSWWAHATRQTRVEAHRKTRLATALSSHEPVRVAMATGLVVPEQARVITEAVDALPGDLTDPATLTKAEEVLLGYAETHDAKALRILGRRLLDVVAPEVAEAHEARQLEREEAATAAATRFTMSDDGHGKCHGRFTVPTMYGEMLRKALLAIAAPKHQTARDGHAPEPRPSAHKLGHAFCEYVERYPTDQLPKAGGLAATVVVTMSVETLLGGLASATLDTGGVISHATARRLACEAGLIPAVLGNDSVALDLGRKTRFHTEPQRTAIALRDQHCTAQGCDWPPGLCHVHHDTPWSRGGGTSVKDGRLLCPRHHARAHDPTYLTTTLPTGQVRFHRRV